MNEEQKSSYDVEAEEMIGGVNSRHINFVPTNQFTDTGVEYFQQIDRVNEIIRCFNVAKYGVNQKYRNYLELSHDGVNNVGSTVEFDKKRYVVMLIDGNYSILFNHNSLVRANHRDISSILIEMDAETASILYKKIFKLVDRSMFDIPTYFTYFSEIFNLDHDIIDEIVPYTHLSMVEEGVINKNRNLLGEYQKDESLW